MKHPLRSGAGVLLLALAAGLAQAASVTLTGTIGNRAILIIDGGAPRTLAPGQTLDGVRLVSVQGDQAVVETAGQRATLRMDTPTSVGDGAAGPGGDRIVLPANSGGHFMTLGAINGRSVNFMVDTGATLVALSDADAQRIGLNYDKKNPVRVNTANGVTLAYRVRLDSVRVGDVSVTGVDAVVSEQPMPYILLGNSFIGRFNMQREGDQMVLVKRY
ncbi:retropepsin-like aspartic protease family protein [Variovorax sp.]|uniref:retropepsin-like aspartic protease family protein n=1 Tax=Variovorax sp. TaxID=1871043 RepID=UPI002D6B8CE9|nr:TIGR02281 family clan AA aspartic protease [Variovorax sp.]HYP84430.1 TIGR02281 family clan AA aspartic protease [Variovorax sp.]